MREKGEREMGRRSERIRGGDKGIGEGRGEWRVSEGGRKVRERWEGGVRGCGEGRRE